MNSFETHINRVLIISLLGFVTKINLNDNYNKSFLQKQLLNNNFLIHILYYVWWIIIFYHLLRPFIQIIVFYHKTKTIQNTNNTHVSPENLTSNGFIQNIMKKIGIPDLNYRDVVKLWVNISDILLIIIFQQIYYRVYLLFFS